jgi:hypothetical protein
MFEVNMSETEPKTNFEMKNIPGTLQADAYMYQQFKKEIHVYRRCKPNTMNILLYIESQ